ncbi:patched domain-containing protein 3 [Scaptodrosophila lebanonensis]|uniref:Patched domain-containing protein 3 n=1 Tax=Drosophila lebanonensis TaxID=7225 RepID=A0A6J2TEW4_DROLE|nr:patched domain-containing protein 3 [Scaptodrosophila lebanonensis]XP_030375301.1 patched domain-containing protein 3 [Scaptodrosophila lebanonensis]
MTCGISCVDRTLNKSFYHLGICIAKHPGYFVIIPVLLTLLCMTGYQQLKYQIDPEYLFSPINGEGKAERAVVEQYFKVNYTHRFNVGRITRPGRFGRVIVIPKDGDENMLRREVFEELRTLDNLIQNATVYYDGDTYTYKEICARWQNECFENDILNLDAIMDDIESGQLNLTFPLMFNPVTWDAHAFPVFFGGTKLTEDNYIISVPAIQLVYFVTADNKRQDAKGAEWEETFLREVGKAENSGMFKHISVSYFASRTLDHELEKNTKTVVPYFSSTFLLMGLFSVLTCMMGDAVRSKPWLGLMGNISAIMATLAAFGLAMYCGIEFIGINLAAPFLMIGIGIDDTFVMLAGWRRTPAKMPVHERMAHMMSEAAVSITITSVTDFISFLIGIISPFRSVKIFCTYSVFAVCFTFVWHITFFAACMAISGYRERKNLHAIFGCKVQAMSVAIKEKRNFLYKAIMAGGINHDDPDNPVDNKDHMLMAFFKDRLAAVINNKWCKIIIILAFASYLVGACYGITQIKEGLERRKLSREDSYSVEFFDREDDYYREFPYRMQVIIEGALNYSDVEVQQQIENLTRTLEHTSYVTSSLYTESWLRSFLSFMDRANDYLNVTIDDEQSFIEAVKEHWLFPGNPFSLDVRFNEDETQIIASRFLIQAVNITDTNHEKEMVRDLRKICKDSPLNASIFHPYFVFFDQFELVRPVSLQAMVIGAIIMMIISFIFIPNILCSLWVAFSVISIELGVAGYMALWDVNLDSISMINLIMCIGFSVDFTAHICYTYMTSKKRSPKARVREALHSLGLPIVQGSTSTILGIIALLLAQSYIFLVFFKMVFLVIFFGAMHGLFLLPVLLSLFGPGSWLTWTGLDDGCDDDIENSESDMKAEKPFANSYYMQYPTMGINGPYGSKGFLGAPYKAYGVDEKDQGLGTSGEDSSESSSSRSQRRQQLAAAAAAEESWRRSSYQNIFRNGAQFQAQPDLYGQQVTAAEWRQRLEVHEQKQRSKQQRRPYENYDMQRDRRNSHGDVIDMELQDPPTPNSSIDERLRRKYDQTFAGSGDDSSCRQQIATQPPLASSSAKRYHRRRSSEDSTRYHQRWPANIEERRARRGNSPGQRHSETAAANYAYRTSPHARVRSSSHHNLYQQGKTQQPPTYQYGDYYH